jgi:membrane protease YdiL (CAAX protease family)
MSEETSTNNSAGPRRLSSGNLASTIFLKEEGLRAGWRLLIFVAFVIGIEFAVSLIVWMFGKPERGTFSISNQFLMEFTGFVAVFGAAFVMSAIEHREFGTYGLPLAGALRTDFWLGWLFGFCEISALVGGIGLFGGYHFGSLAVHGVEIARWAFLYLIFFMVVAFFEEFLFRGYALQTLAEGIGFWPAAIAVSLLFGAVHRQNPGENWIGVFGVFVVGLFWCFTVRRTGTLWFALGMHASFDFGETFLYSVPDSGTIFPGHLSNAIIQGPAWLTGGSVGPEASLIDFLLLAIFFYAFHLMFPAKKTKAAENLQTYRTL